MECLSLSVQSPGKRPPYRQGNYSTVGHSISTRPTLANYVGPRADLVHSATRVFDMITGGHLSVNIDQRRPITDVVSAHVDLEAGKTTGSTVFLP